MLFILNSKQMERQYVTLCNSGNDGYNAIAQKLGIGRLGKNWLMISSFPVCRHRNLYYMLMPAQISELDI